MTVQPRLSPEAFAEAACVSRETLERLRVYAAALTKWQARINLVSASTLTDLWRRHFLDSAQLAPFLGSTIVDLGSGGGFPGLVLAIMTGRPTVLIESDSRKCAFLREAARLTGTAVTVLSTRIESAASAAGDTVTARALAPLTDLVAWSVPIFARTNVEAPRAVFLKGQNVEGEIETLSKMWDFDVELFPSVTEHSGRIVVLKRLQAKA